MAKVSLKQIVKRYDDKASVIDGVDLEIADGELVVFVGPSGCGKSTLLRMIAGLESITGGELHIGERLANDIPPAQRGLAMVFQSYALYPHMTVFENMAFALKLAGVKGAALKEAVERAAAVLQIGPLLQRRPKELSGGQRQRVAIGRAIVRQPEVFLFDEPLSNLDASLRVQMRVEISRLHRDLGTTMIYVTHDQVEAMTLGQRIVVINRGRIEQVGTPFDLYQEPGNLFVAGFLGAPKMNFMAGKVAAFDAHGVDLDLPGGARLRVQARSAPAGIQPGDPVTLGVRAEHMALADAGAGAMVDAGLRRNLIALTVGHVEYLGDQTIVYTTMDQDPALIAIRQPQSAQPLRPGERIMVELPAAHCHLFGADGVAIGRHPAH